MAEWFQQQAASGNCQDDVWLEAIVDNGLCQLAGSRTEGVPGEDFALWF